MMNISPPVTSPQLWEILKGFTSQLRFISQDLFTDADAESCFWEVVVFAGNTIYAQGPMANTVHNFWAMVQVYTIHYTV